MFLPPDQVQMEWDEPRLFTFRTLTVGSYAWRFVVFASFAAVFALAGVAESQRRVWSAATAVLVVLLASGVLTLFITAPPIQRRITISRDGINWSPLVSISGNNPLLRLVWCGVWTRLEIKRVLLLPPGDPGNSFGYGLMVIEPKYASPGTIGIANQVSLDRLAQQLSDNGIAVTVGAQELPAAGKKGQ